MLANELNPDNIEPPIHTENLLSGGATTYNKYFTLIFIVEGARVVTSF
jgi:hypothetical protein